MRVEFSPVLLLVVLFAGAMGLARAQEGADGESGGTGDSAVSAAKKALLNDVKKLAQDTALPALRGEDKFVLRESWWGGNIAPGKAKLIQVQLFRRNSYQFWLAVPNRSAELNLNIYDSEGNIVPSEDGVHSTSNVASTVVKPETTGTYYVRISLKTTIDQDQDWAVIYAYR